MFLMSTLWIRAYGACVAWPLYAPGYPSLHCNDDTYYTVTMVTDNKLPIVTVSIAKIKYLFIWQLHNSKRVNLLINQAVKLHCSVQEHGAFTLDSSIAL